MDSGVDNLPAPPVPVELETFSPKDTLIVLGRLLGPLFLIFCNFTRPRIASTA